MKGVQCYELLGGIALKNHDFFVIRDPVANGDLTAIRDKVNGDLTAIRDPVVNGDPDAIRDPVLNRYLAVERDVDIIYFNHLNQHIHLAISESPDG